MNIYTNMNNVSLKEFELQVKLGTGIKTGITYALEMLGVSMLMPG
jgi:hypothetical protein